MATVVAQEKGSASLSGKARATGVTPRSLLLRAFGEKSGLDDSDEPMSYRSALTGQGRLPFTNLVSLLRNPSAPDGPGIGALGFGFLVTTLLMVLRTRFVWWPFHPVGYAIANTNTMTTTWLPFFLGLIAGDLVGGGLFTAVGAFTGINIYLINW